MAPKVLKTRRFSSISTPSVIEGVRRCREARTADGRAACMVMPFVPVCGLRDREKVIVPGAQTVRRGDAGRVRGLLGRRTSPAACTEVKSQQSGAEITWGFSRALVS